MIFTEDMKRQIESVIAGAQMGLIFGCDDSGSKSSSDFVCGLLAALNGINMDDYPGEMLDGQREWINLGASCVSEIGKGILCPIDARPDQEDPS